MTRILAHRGPDAEGFFISDNLGLGHRRLAIVDLSPTGAQPMSTDDGSCWITYNGEFYNHMEFRTRLVACGCRFRGSSDTETMLRLIERDGPESLAGVAGIFAFAFWDGRSQTLTLARDPLGVKQIYFHDNGRRIVFASEIKALLEDPGVPRDPDPEAINQYLHFHTPLFDRTFFRGIRQLRPGEYLQINRYGARLVSYWAVTDFTRLSGSDSELIDSLREQLGQVVGQQLMSDVPVGSFFSGGIDSSAVAAFASQTGRKPVCFGVHFSGQGVVDERPYQEAAAAALGLDLRLITMDGSDFPDEFRRLMYHQDQPVIGAAMFPMSRVSRLASAEVKVCLGGQAADEIFGGYARYALGQPTRVIRSWFSGRGHAPAGHAAASPESGIGANLARQFAEGGTLRRLARNAHHFLNWETRYFEHFAKVPEHSWNQVFSAREFCSRIRCRQLFHDYVRRSPATDPMDKVMHWDLQTYLPGLFHQDDRMSMASGLESRVPFADPRLVRFAFKVDPDLRIRGGASKWILRKSVSNVLPSMVLGRRKVGFDTPAEAWLNQHESFVHDTLLSSQSLQRGFWSRRGLESLLASRRFDVLWKVLSIELWASLFLSGAAPSCPMVPQVSKKPSPTPRLDRKIQYLARGTADLGLKGTLARGAWEVKIRSGLTRLADTTEISNEEVAGFLKDDGWKLPFADPKAVAASMRYLLPSQNADRLAWLASEATRGRILCFGRWMADFGNPIDWHRDPTNEYRWPVDSHWARAVRGGHGQTEVKFTWEAARFPQAYLLARAAALDPQAAPHLAAAFSSQVLNFISRNPRGRGLHWFSGQEIVLRQLAWLFGIHVFSESALISDSLRMAVGRNLAASGAHLAENIEYTRDSIYNNHLLSEALGLLVTGSLLKTSSAKHWRAQGLELLSDAADRQIYTDGASIQDSHNYHRFAMQIYLWATAFMRRNGDEVPQSWVAAMERSLEFLFAHQNEADGRLPNYGSNDGSHPLILATTDFSDFRPLLQALSVAIRGERIYTPGPWDEMAVWLFGTNVLDLPVRPIRKTSVSFAASGYHVLRGTEPGSFCAFRCGSVRGRFAQIDMLHLDVWWRGENVLADPGSYLYNGPAEWHNHFMRTGSHNTVQIDGGEQMPHIGQFRTLRRTLARLLHFEDTPDWALCEGEHYGYLREEKCVHRRGVLFLKEAEVWVIADTISGEGRHEARLHWLAGNYHHEFAPGSARLRLETPHGWFSVSVHDRIGSPVGTISVASGVEEQPRGWLSRYYGEKIPVASLVSTDVAPVPITFVTVACPGSPSVSVSGEDWTIRIDERMIRFRLHAESSATSSFTEIATAGMPVPELPT